MKISDIISRAGKNLRQAKARTILTSLAIGVGAFTIALAMAAGNGGRDYLDSMIDSLGSMRNINVNAAQDASTDVDDGPRKVGEAEPVQSQYNFKMMTAKDIEKLEAIDGVEVVLPMYDVMLESISANGSDEYVGVMRVQYDDSAIDIQAGELGDNYEIKPGHIVFAHAFLEPFGYKSADDALGDTVTATFAGTDGSKFTREFVVQAVDEEPTSPLAFYSNEFRISNQDGQEISDLQRPSGTNQSFFGVMVRAEPGADVDAVKQAITDAGAFEAQTFADMRSSVMQVVNIVQYGLMGFGALAILASIFGIINTQYISVLERTSQIGLMKALGMRRRDVSRLFRYEAAWIGFLGGVIGVGLAFLITLLNPVINGLLNIDDDIRLLQMDWLMSVILVVGLMLIAIVSGWFPSRKAAKLDPIEALRTE